MVSKVDNPDMIASRLRILDEKGNISTFGRVEVQELDGIFYPICNVNEQSNKNNAIRLCKIMGYTSGLPV